jgi:glycosyltransferase involved in cell wall biosynthesis
MKILSISTNVKGGAGVAAYRLHQKLLEKGVDSLMLVKNKTIDDAKIIGPEKKWEKFYHKTWYRLDKLPRLFFKTGNKGLHSAAIFSSLSLGKVKKINPDIIHLNWVCGGFVSPFDLPKLKKPIVWTLHDAWAFSGANHFINGDERYRLGYDKKYRPAHESGFDLNKFVWQRKKRAWKNLKNITIVTPSRWLADLARQSILFREYPIEVIPNGVDAAIFRPGDKTKSRAALNLPLDKKIILFGAVDALEDPKKGWAYLAAAARLLATSELGKKAAIAVFGSPEPTEPIDISLPIYWLGKIAEQKKLAEIYSAADIFAAPYLEDNFPSAILEAMACGVPAVAFRAGGVPDIITHGQDGYLAEPLDAADLAVGIEKTLARAEELGKAARIKIEENFTLEKQALKYIELYKKILTDQCAK